MRSYRLQITTPEGVLFEGDATQLSVRAVDGELAVMAGHTSTLSVAFTSGLSTDSTVINVVPI